MSLPKRREHKLPTVENWLNKTLAVQIILDRQKFGYQSDFQEWEYDQAKGYLQAYNDFHPKAKKRKRTKNTGRGGLDIL